MTGQQTKKARAQVIFMKPAVLLAVQMIGPYSEAVPKAWTTIFGWMDREKPDPMPTVGYGFTYDDPRRVAAEDLRYVASVIAPSRWNHNSTSEVSPLSFEGGTFLRSTVVGPYDQIGQSISSMRDQWIPKNGLVLDQNKPILTIYRSDPRVIEPQEQVADVCLPVFADRRHKPRDE